MRWPDSWWVEEKCSAPDAYWAEKVASLGDSAKYVGWSRGRVAGPLWFRRLVGDHRKPLFNTGEAE